MFFFICSFVHNSICSSRIKSEENQDKSIEILQKWIPSVEGSYHSIYHKLVHSGKEETPTKWTPDRFAHIIELKEEALMKGREMWADWVWVSL